MDRENLKCFFCGAIAEVMEQGDLKVVSCPKCKRDTELDEYQDMFDVWLGDIRTKDGERQMFVYLDTETTGSGPEDRLCQIAFKTDTGTTVDELFNTNMPISVEAMSIHHITNEVVANKLPFKGQAIC